MSSEPKRGQRLDLTTERVRALVGSGAYLRGVRYADEDRVSELRVDDGRASALVSGQQVWPYRTEVAVDGWDQGDCTCPIGGGCKHVAAVLLTILREAEPEAVPEPERQATAPEPQRWASVLDKVVRMPSLQEPDDGAPLALQFDLTIQPPHVAAALQSLTNAAVRVRTRSLTVHPVVRGRTGRWVRSGVKWVELAAGYGGYGRSRRHALLLRQLALAHRSSGYQRGELNLDGFDQDFWRHLRRAVNAGVELVPARKWIGTVTLSRAPAVVTLAVSRQPDARGAVLEPVVVHGGRQLPLSAVTLIGDPAHGLFAEDERPDGAELLLVPLDPPLTDVQQRLVDQGRLEIPQDELDAFVADYYPRLRQLIPVTSDGSVALPQITPPRLTLRVTFTPVHRACLGWGFTYQVGDDVTHVPLSAAAALAGAGDADPTIRETLRNGDAEREVLDRLTLPSDVLPQLVATNGDPVEQIELTGLDVAVFCQDVLPVLMRDESLLVEIDGEIPDYRRSESSPQITLSTSDGDQATDWYDLAVSVTIDDEEIPFERLFLALANGETELLLDSGTFFSIDRPELLQLRRLIMEARNLQERGSSGLRINPYQVGLWEELLQLGVVAEQSERWAEAVSALSDIGAAEEVKPPAGLAAELRPYQLDGYRWLSLLWDARLGGVLADDMGLGKTLQTLAMIARARESGRLEAPVLVVAPASVVANWQQEVHRFTPGLSVATVTETQAKRRVPLSEQVAGMDVVVTSYALFRIDYEAFDALRWSGLVLDEAQFVKNHQGKTYQCARRLAAPFKLAITGTPLENSLMDLWSMLSITAPGLFPDPKAFSDHYRRPIESGRDPALLATLRRLVRPLMLRRTKDQVARDLPPKQEQILEVPLGARHERIYQTHLQRERQKVLGLIHDLDANRFEIFRSLTLLRQLSLAPALVDEKYEGVRSSKVDALLEQLAEVVGEGHRALVFSQFTRFLAVVRERLEAEGIEYEYLDGSTRDRATRIDRFRQGEAPVFLISLKAGGFGLNLTEADYCFVLDPWWNPAVEAQAVDRAHRIGQLRTVMVYRLVSSGTIEEKVMALKARKADLFARVIDDGAAMSSSLTADDIRGLFSVDS
ncbi:MAG TPA: DEAD/DEAH box helicase [Actinomycetales bacterium]|nr:DEAD/DEAH box helicase [Actinomycetales bacterium]